MGSILNQQSLRSFNAEIEFLEKIGFPIPRVGRLGRALSTVGRNLGGGLGRVGKGITELPQAGRETLSIASHPLKAMKKGWKSGKWMGEGKYTKWLPIGAKSMTVGFAAPGLIDAYHATKEAPTPTGEGGVAEKLLGEVGGTGGFLAGMASKRFLPGMALMIAGQYGGGKMGRIIDRLRGGANLGTAVGAPSPSEAESQLEDVQRYYG